MAEPDAKCRRPGDSGSRSAGIILIATIVLILFHYWLRADTVGFRPAAGDWMALTGRPVSSATHLLGSGLLLGVLPLLAGCWLYGLKINRLGLGKGRWREGLLWLILGAPVALVVARIGAETSAMRAVYPLDPELSRTATSFLPHTLLQGGFYAGWEILFRGVLLFGLRDRLGTGAANSIQTAFSVLAHFGHPWPETVAALPFGLAFGAVSLRLGSIWYVAALHWLAGAALNWFVLS